MSVLPAPAPREVFENTLFKRSTHRLRSAYPALAGASGNHIQYVSA